MFYSLIFGALTPQYRLSWRRFFKTFRQAEDKRINLGVVVD
jgi:hypothetical protein